MSGLNRDRLDGWKAIAEFLTRDERTVQRWARERGLPVHRVSGTGTKGSVFAFRRELDQWLAAAPQVPHSTAPAAAPP